MIRRIVESAMPKKTCRKCSRPSLPGLSVGICQFHWNEGVWGTAWAIYASSRNALGGGSS